MWFIVNPNFPWLGANPDCLINDPNEQASSLGLGEVKCPYSKRDSTIKVACSDPNFCLVIKEDKIVLKRNHSYYFRIHGTMTTLQLQWCDFVVHTNKDIFIERILTVLCGIKHWFQS
jgi:hypothetical protein